MKKLIKVIIVKLKMCPQSKNIDELLESQAFFDLMQQYRNAPLSNQDMVVSCFENVKRFLKLKLIK